MGKNAFSYAIEIEPSAPGDLLRLWDRFGSLTRVDESRQHDEQHGTGSGQPGSPLAESLGSTGSHRVGRVSAPNIRSWRNSGHGVHRGHRAGSLGDYKWTHHLVILVLEDVAVPDEATRGAELRLDARDFARVGDDCILEPGLSRLRRPGYPDERAGGRVER